MLKNYIYNGHQYQWHEGNQPEGAVEVVEKKAAEPSNKAKKTANKAKKVSKK